MPAAVEALVAGRLGDDQAQIESLFSHLFDAGCHPFHDEHEKDGETALDIYCENFKMVGFGAGWLAEAFMRSQQVRRSPSNQVTALQRLTQVGHGVHPAGGRRGRLR